MAIDFSYGYPGTIAPGTAWARMQWGLGTRYWVYHQDNVRVTPVPNGTRQVSISPGYFGAWGILDHNETSSTVSLPTVSSGTKWFLIIARRTWQTTNATTFSYIDCGTSPTYPAARVSDPGVLDEQPLAFVPVTAGNTVPGTPRDVRVIGTSPENQIITDELALGYMAYVGVRLRLGTTQYVRGLNSSGNPVWQIEPGPWGKVSLSRDEGFGTSRPEWSTAGLGGRAVRNGNSVEILFRTRKTTGGNLDVGLSGHITDRHIFTLDQEYWPDAPVYASCTYINHDLSNSIGHITVTTDGRVMLTAGTPGMDLAVVPAGSWSISSTFNFIQES